MKQKIEALKEIVRQELSYAAHDLDHVLRVYQLCILLAKEEKDVDMEVLIPAVLLHDIARRQEDEDRTGEIDHAILGAEMAAAILLELDYDTSHIDQIKYCITAHRFRSGLVPETVEAKILFDADKLDVIGAVGIARSFMLAGQHSEKMYSAIPVEEYIKENVGKNGRIKDVSKHTTNLEFELKLKKIPDRLFTQKAREIAKERIAYMQEFFETLRKEISDEKYSY